MSKWTVRLGSLTTDLKVNSKANGVSQLGASGNGVI